MSYVAIARKYRPTTFEDMVGQEHVTRTLRNALTRDRIHHAFLFTGTRGVGKTTAVTLLMHKALKADPALRKAINAGEVMFIDQHLSETVELLRNKQLGKLDVAIIEASAITEDGGIVPTTSVGNSASFVVQADQIIESVAGQVGGGGPRPPPKGLLLLERVGVLEGKLGRGRSFLRRVGKAVDFDLSSSTEGRLGRGAGVSIPEDPVGFVGNDQVTAAVKIPIVVDGIGIPHVVPVVRLAQHLVAKNPDRRIIVMLHGLASSPEAWINVANEVLGDEELRRNFQIWQVYYPTNLPIAVNNQAIRQAIEQTLRNFDPQGEAKASHDMVLVGHSMGGVLSRLMVSSSGERLWDAMLSDFDIKGARVQKVKASLGPYLYFEPLPQVSRAVFAAAPHRDAVVYGAICHRDHPRAQVGRYFFVGLQNGFQDARAR